MTDGNGRGPMPPEIAGAIVKIMAGAKQLGFDEKNLHGGYSYASIDKFLAAFRPLCAEHGLIIMLDESGCEFRAQGERGTSYAFLDYEVWLIHQGGVTWGPLTRRLALPATGPQAFGAAESYVLKRFMRNLFQVPTGEKDADDLAEGAIPPRPKVRQAGSKPADPPHDPKTGEIKPHGIVASDPVNWGGKFIAAIKTATSVAELEAWLVENGRTLADIAANHPKIQRSIEASLTAARDKLEQTMVEASETETVLS